MSGLRTRKNDVAERFFSDQDDMLNFTGMIWLCIKDQSFPLDSFTLLFIRAESEK